MDPRRRLLDLSTQRSAQLQAAAAAMEANDQAAFDAAIAQVHDLDGQIANVQALIDAQDATPAAPPAAAPTPEQERAANRRRSSNEYSRAFYDAVRMGATPRNARNFGDRFGILLDALTETGGNPAGTDGGFLVPVDLQTRINELSRQLLDLSQLVTVESVTTLTGYRVIDTKPTTGFTKINSEMGQIPTDDQPSFTRVPYSVEEYSLIVPISNDLLSDETAGLMEYLARWMSRKAVLTRNGIILTKLATLTATDIAADGELAAIKAALNKGLDPAISANARMLTNQSGFNVLDTLEDSVGHPLLQQDVTQGTGRQVLGHGITFIGDAFLANVATKGSPLYIGDFKEFMTIFERQPMEFATTNVGGNAWRTNSTEARAIMRLDARVMDSAAAKLLCLAAGL